MTETLAGLRHKLDGAGKLGSVVRAMKAVAASSIGQYEAAVRSVGDYERSVELGLSVCLRGHGRMPAEPGRAKDRLIGAIVFGSDQGLVGRFNEVIADFALQTLNALPGRKKVWVVGARVAPHFEAARIPVVRTFAVPSSVAAITPLVSALQLEIEAGCASHEYSEIHVIHNHPQSAALYAPLEQRLLPLDAQWHNHLTGIKWPTANLPEILGTTEITLRALVSEYLFISLYKACAESLASENGSRLQAMQRAQKNIETLAANLNQSFNRLRQSSIDEELFDVITGFNALTPATRQPRYESP